MDDVSDEAGASLSQSFGMDKADIFFGRTLKLTLGWKIRSHRSEKGKKIMGEDPQSLENHGFPQISRLVLHSIKSLEIKGLTVVRNYKSCGGAENGVTVKVTPFFWARRKILCKRFSTKSRMALENRADSGLDPLITESHGGQNGMCAGTA